MGHTLTYLTTDSLSEGIGTSQVLRYVERLADRGWDVRLHSFEKAEPPADVRAGLADRGVHWTAHPFGRLGPVGGLGRVVRGAWALRRAHLVHARSDLAAASALLALRRRWLWDVRSLWSDELIQVGRMRQGGAEERVMRLVERGAARRSTAIVTLAAAVVPVLAERHGRDVAAKASVVPTCVDLDRFPLHPMPVGDEVQVLLSGTVNGLYDGPAMVRLVERLRARTPVRFVVLGAHGSPWDAELAAAADHRARVAPAEVPGWLAEAHVGLSMWRPEVGAALTGAMPTKIGELLATGRPVVINPGLGDMDELIATYRCGVVAADDDDAIDRAAAELLALLAEPDLPDRCRAAAVAHFDLEQGVDRLVAAYEKMGGTSSS